MSSTLEATKKFKARFNNEKKKHLIFVYYTTRTTNKISGSWPHLRVRKRLFVSLNRLTAVAGEMRTNEGHMQACAFLREIQSLRGRSKMFIISSSLKKI